MRIDPWMLLNLQPEDPIVTKISFCIAFFETPHPLLEHIAVMDFVACQMGEDRKFEEVWKRYSCISREDFCFVTRSIASIKRF